MSIRPLRQFNPSKQARSGLASSLAIIALAVCAVATAVPAYAAPATVVQGRITFPTQEFDDPDVCATEGFVVHATLDEQLDFHIRLDGAGNFVDGFAHHDLSFVITANGKTLFENDHYNNTFAADGTSTGTGSIAHIQGQHGGIVLRDAGRIVFDADKNPTFIAGPHPQFLGQTFCSALMP